MEKVTDILDTVYASALELTGISSGIMTFMKHSQNNYAI